MTGREIAKKLRLADSYGQECVLRGVEITIAAHALEAAPGEAAEELPCRHDTRTAEREQRLQSLGYEPAGEQRRLSWVERKRQDPAFAAAMDAEIAEMRREYPDPQPAESTLGGERPICAVYGAAFHRGDCTPADPAEAAPGRGRCRHCDGSGRDADLLACSHCKGSGTVIAPTDPGEELRALRQLEAYVREFGDMPAHFPEIAGPVLAQLDALRAAREVKP